MSKVLKDIHFEFPLKGHSNNSKINNNNKIMIEMFSTLSTLAKFFLGHPYLPIGFSPQLVIRALCNQIGRAHV